MRRSSRTERKDISRREHSRKRPGRSSSTNFKNPMLPPIPRGRIIMGRNCIREVAAHSPDRFIKVFGTEVESKAARVLVDELEQRHIHIERLPRDTLSEIVGTDTHQGFVAVLRERHFDGVRSYIERSEKEESSLCLILDSIMDPQNLGTLLRVAECFNVDAVIWSKNRGVDLTPTVAKASVGASELTNIIRVSNLADTVQKLRDGGFWVASFADEKDAHDLSSFEYPSKCALIVGSEDQGVQRLLREKSDYLIRIPTSGKIRSLNVSQAASIGLAEFRMQQMRRRRA